MNKSLLNQCLAVFLVFILLSVNFESLAGESKITQEAAAVLVTHKDQPDVWNKIKVQQEKSFEAELEKVDEVLEAEVVHALQSTGQTGEFLVYQFNNNERRFFGAGYSGVTNIDGKQYKTIFLANPHHYFSYPKLGVKVIRATLYHELGHHYNNHSEKRAAASDDIKKAHEWEADRFMIDHLLRKKDIASLVFEFNLFIHNHMIGGKSCHRYSSPCNRALLIAKELHKAGYDLLHLPIDEELQKKFTRNLYKTCVSKVAMRKEPIPLKASPSKMKYVAPAIVAGVAIALTIAKFR